MIKKGKRIKEDMDYFQFLKDPENEDALRHAVLKPGKVKPIHIDDRTKLQIGVEWDNILNKPCLRTCDEIDAAISTPVASLLTIEDLDPSISMTSMRDVLVSLCRMEDALTGAVEIEDTL